MRLVLRLHPDQYNALRNADRQKIEDDGCEVWCDPSRTPGEAMIMDIGPLLEVRRRDWFRWYDYTMSPDNYNASQTHIEAF